MNAPPAGPIIPGVQAGSTSGLIPAQRVIVYGPGGSGVFGYNPAPGQNNLVFSEAGMAGKDQFGNQYLAGSVSYSGSTAVQIGGSGLTYYTNSSGQTGTWTSQGSIKFQAATSPQLVLPSGYTGTIAASQSDATSFTATGTGATRMSKQWDIPANDPNVNTIYRFSAFGQGTQGTTANNSSWTITVGAVNVINLNIPAANWPASEQATFYLQVNFQFTATGSSGNANAFGVWLLTNSSTGAAIYAASLIDITNTINTTADNKLQWNWQWATATGGPTITCYGTSFERISG